MFNTIKILTAAAALLVVAGAVQACPGVIGPDGTCYAAPRRAPQCLTDNCLPQLSPEEMTAKNRAAAAAMRGPDRPVEPPPPGASKMPCLMKVYSDLVIHGTSDIDVMERCDVQPSEIAFVLDQIVDGNPQLRGPTPFKDAHCKPTWSGFACEYNGVTRRWTR
jgi:hypothetical protein